MKKTEDEDDMLEDLLNNLPIEKPDRVDKYLIKKIIKTENKDNMLLNEFKNKLNDINI